MADPFRILGLPADCDDEAVRRRFLELAKQHPPEQQPEKFAAVRAAYEKLRDRDARLRYQLFESGREDDIEAIVEELICRSTRRRLSLEELLGMLGER